MSKFKVGDKVLVFTRIFNYLGIISIVSEYGYCINSVNETGVLQGMSSTDWLDKNAILETELTELEKLIYNVDNIPKED